MATGHMTVSLALATSTYIPVHYPSGCQAKKSSEISKEPVKNEEAENEIKYPSEIYSNPIKLNCP
ncbi:hypothetical protein ACF0H5_014503 [Mactra antiquata]